MIILTKDEAAKINAGNIKQIFSSARDILLERQRMYAEYECKDFEELFTPIFAISRISGWCAHRLEEIVNNGKIIRPAYKYVADHLDYVPLEERE